MGHGGEPSSQQALVEGYQALLSRTRTMLASAHDADWSALVDQEGEYVMQVERLARLDAELHLDADHQLHKAQLLEQILENDLEIRERLIERRDELGKLIGTTQRQRSVRRAYGAGEKASTSPIDMRLTKRSP
ncbi:flagellar protein FliT [Halomonas daqiaonensis]|uniref:Flagellar protein FliT n=1 Tax=Halomonas daqiaonensis TaxID=650850 RepID=A0A1H7SRG9_9GAMM|nr:flagellar protein FliT [Halomonas daqiaonensis]SEL74989.1 flagellar protein FliT [Halomonas daqiaonensis]